jgi:hypothetical protein
MEEGYLQVVEKRGINPGYKLVQIFPDPFEVQVSKDGKEDASLWRRTSTTPVRATLRGFEFNGETFETGQRGQASDHRLR